MEFFAITATAFRSIEQQDYRSCNKNCNVKNTTTHTIVFLGTTTMTHTHAVGKPQHRV